MGLPCRLTGPNDMLVWSSCGVRYHTLCPLDQSSSLILAWNRHSSLSKIGLDLSHRHMPLSKCASREETIFSKIDCIVVGLHGVETRKPISSGFSYMILDTAFSSWELSFCSLLIHSYRISVPEVG